MYYVTPTEDNIYQTEKMKSHGIFSDVYQEVGEIIVADVNQPRIEELLAPDREALRPADPQGGLNGLLYPPELRSTREKPRGVRVECNSAGICSGR